MLTAAWNSIVRAGHGMRIAVGLWIGFTIAADVKAWKHPDEHTVYPVFVEGARRWLNDGPLYTEGFYYSPVFAAVMSPLANLSDRAGGVIWGTFNLAIVFVALAVFCRHIVQRLRPEIRQGPFLALCLPATVHGCWSRQSNALVMALVLLAVVAAVVAEKGRKGEREKGGKRTSPHLPLSTSPAIPFSPAPFWWAAALLLATATHIKFWVIAVPALLALRWFQPLVPRFLAAFVLAGTLPMAAKPPAQVLACYQQWFTCLAERMATGERWVGYRDAWTIWENFATPVNRQVFSAASLAAALLTAVWCWRRSRRKTPEGYVLAVVAAWSCWQLLFGPGAERMTYGIIAPAVSWAVCESFLARRYRTLALTAWLLTGVLGTGEVETRMQAVVPFAQAMMPLGAALTAVWLLCNRAQTAHSSSSSGEADDWSTTCSSA